MKVRIRKRTNELFALKPPGSKKKVYNIINEVDNLHIEAINSIGFNNVEYISKGLYGSVYRGTWDEHDGVEHAIKVMPANDDGKKEAKIYRTISDARKNNKLIAKHFPRVDMTRYDKERNLILIVMEILDSDPNVRSVIQDIFGQGEVGKFRPELSLDDMDVQKNIGKRANLMVTDEKTKGIVLDKMLYFVPNRKEEVKSRMMTLNLRGVKRLPRMYKAIKRNYKTGSKMFDLIDVLRDDLLLPDKGGKFLGADAFNFAIRFIYECMKAWEKDFEEDFSVLFKEIEPAIEDFINIYRQWTPVGIVPKGSPFLQGAPPEAQGAGYPGVKSILKAIEELEVITGLEARDMHDHNVLVRPQTKEIVIVDVGMFEQGSPTRFQRGQPPKYERETTAMEEAFPHAGIPTGAQRKQNGEKEHAGHVERSMHQGLRNVMDEIDKMIDEELEAVLAEDCWDGYIRNYDIPKGQPGSCKKRTNEEELDEKKKKRKKAGTESSKESSLRDWFGRKGAKGKKKGWVDCNSPDGDGGYKSCGRSSGEKRKKYPSCRPTPGACKEKGKGKSWGKKAKKRGKKK